MNARVFDRVVLQYRSRPIPVFYRDRRLSSPCRHLLPINIVSNSYSFINCLFNHIRSSRSPVHSKSSTCAPRTMWVTDSLNFMSSGVFPEMVLPNHRGGASSIHGTFKLGDVLTRCCQGVFRWQLHVQRPPCVAIQCLDTCQHD